jgi:hypothetical protein
MTLWYVGHFVASYGPWAAPNTGNCPNTEAIYNELTANSNELSDAITTNLQGMATVADNASPGVRVLIIGYPYAVDYGNPCYNDWGSPSTEHGVVSTVDKLNDAGQAVSSSRVKFVDNAAAFGGTPVNDGYISTNRLYGYPHPSTSGSPSGQLKIALEAISMLLGSGW